MVYAISAQTYVPIIDEVQMIAVDSEEVVSVIIDTSLPVNTNISFVLIIMPHGAILCLFWYYNLMLLILAWGSNF